MGRSCDLALLSLDFFTATNPSRYMQLHNVICAWIINCAAWVLTAMYVYTWYDTVLPPFLNATE